MFKEQIDSVKKELFDLVDEIDTIQYGKVIEISGWRIYLDYEDKSNHIQVGSAVSISKWSCLDLHIHKDSNEIFILQNGRLKIEIDYGDIDKQVILKVKESTVFIQKGLEHRVTGLDEGTEFIYIMFPSDYGLDRMFKKK